MSMQEAINTEYAQLKRARNSRSLKAQYNAMTNEELLNYVRGKWEQILRGDAA